MKKLFHSLFNQLRIKFIVITSLLFLIFAALVLGLWFYINQNYAKNTSQQTMNQLLSASTSLFESQLLDTIHIVSRISVRTGSYNSNPINILTDPTLTDAEILKYRKDAEESLIKLCSNKNYLNGLEITNFSGKSITYGLTTPYETLCRLGLTDKLAESSTGYFFIIPHINEKYSTKNQVFSLVKPVFSNSGTLAGYVVADLKCSLIDDIYSVQNKSENYIYILDNKTGRIIYTPDRNTTDYSDISSEKYVLAHYQSDLTDWTIISATPTHYILQDFYDTQNFIIVITIIFLLIFLTTNYFLINRLTKNIRLLSSSVNHINEDCLELNIQIHSNDETGVLYTSFQAMLLRIHELIRKVRETESQKRSADLRALQAQINPHFLYNTLNTIKFLAVINGNQNISLVAESLTGLMHTNMQPGIFISLQEEKQYLENYLEIQKYHYTFHFEYSIDLPDKAAEYYIPKMLLQPLVENSLKHGYLGRMTDNTLTVSFQPSSGELLIRLFDNGIGMTQEQIQSSLSQCSMDHIGIANVKQRIQLYFGEASSITIQSVRNRFTEITLRIPLITAEEIKNYV